MTDVLTAGSIAFTGFNADGDDSLAFVSFSDIKAGTVIHFTDNAWNGTSFATDENVWSWTATSDVAAGTIISMSGLGAGGSAASNTGSVAFDTANARDIADANEVVYAYTGDASSPVFLTAITNAIFNASLGRGTLNGTGLTQGVDAKQLNGSPDIAVYVGDRSSLASVEDYRAHIYDTANWQLQGGDGDQSHDGTAPDLPFSTQAFSADPTAQKIEFASVTASVAEGDSGDTVLTLTLNRIGSTVGVTTFSGTVANASGMYGYADGDDFGGTLPVFSGSFADGASTATVTFHISGDTTYEPDEHFFAILDTVASGSGLTYIGDKAVVDATIVNDDPVQFFGFAENSLTVSRSEGNAGDVTTFTFVVERTQGTAGDLSFSGTISSGSADAADFGGTAPLTFSGVIKAGESTATVSIITSGDVTLEGNDSFSLHLTDATSSNGTTIVNTYLDATGIIVNDDPLHIGTGDSVTSPLTLAAGDHLTIDQGGTLAVPDPLDGSPVNAMLWSGGTVTVDNAGNLGLEGIGYNAVYGANVTGSFTFNNAVTGVVDGAITFARLGSGSVVTVNNAGLLDGSGNYALNLVDVGKVSTVIVNNLAGGIITSDQASNDGVRAGPNTVVNNAGIIRSAADDAANGNYGGDGIDYAGSTGGIVHNYTGGLIEASRHAVTNKKGITVINDAGASLIGRNGSGINIDNDATVANTVYVTNRGTIIGASAGYEDSDGDAIDADGLLKLDNYGMVEGIGANGYHNGEVNVSEGIAAGGGVINNYAGGMIYGYGRAIQVDDSSNGPALGATTVYNEGQIRGDGHGPAGVSDEDAAAMNAKIAGGEAINIVGSYADTITNSGGILGGVKTDGGDDTLTNSGLMVATGGSAIDLGDGNDSFTNSGIVSGNVLLGAGDDTVNIYAGSTSGTIDGGDGYDTIHAYAAPGSSAAGVVGPSANVEKLDIASGSWMLGYGFNGANIEVESGATITSGAAATAMGLTGGQTLTIDRGGTVVGTKFAIGISGGDTDALVVNSGTIRVASTPGTKADAITMNGGTATIHNTSTGYIDGARHAITGPLGIHVINDAGGVIVGRNGSAVNMDNSPIVAYTAYVDNYGTMLGQSANISDSDGDAVDVDGFAVINNYGNIRGEGANGYHKGEANVSEGIAIGGGTINNYAGGNIYGYGRAIEVDDSSNGAAFSSTIINNAGMIEGGGHGPTGVADADVALFAGRLKGGEAINIIGNYADTITNSGRILGGVKTGGGDDSLTNSGIMVATGGSAVDLGAGGDTFTNSGIVSGDVLLGAGDDTVNLVAGSTVSGTIDGGDGNDTINLTGTGAGTLGKGTGIETVDVKSGAWAIDSDASYSNVTVESGASLVVRGAVTTGTVEQGAGQFVYGHADHTIVFGEQAIHAGGIATATTIGAGGEQNVVEGAAANGTAIEGGTQHVYGSADDTTIDAAGLQQVHGRATDTVVNSGGEQNVYKAATVIGTIVNSGGIQIDWGTAVATTIDGGSQYVYGTATDTVILSGTQYIGTGGATYGTMIGSGGTAHAFGGASVHNATFAGSDATLVLDHASDFSGFISGWQDGNHLDLSDIQFGNSTTLAYVTNGGDTGGKLTVSDGSHTVSLALLGQYTAADFALASDGHGGTVITDPGVGAQQSPLALPHAA